MKANWIAIPKDKYGLFEDDGTMYAELPIIVYEEDKENETFYLHYVDKENWSDSVSDFNKPRYCCYLPCPPVPIVSNLTTKTGDYTDGYHDPTDEELADRKPDDQREEIGELFNK